MIPNTGNHLYHLLPCLQIKCVMWPWHPQNCTHTNCLSSGSAIGTTNSQESHCLLNRAIKYFHSLLYKSSVCLMWMFTKYCIEWQALVLRIKSFCCLLKTYILILQRPLDQSQIGHWDQNTHTIMLLSHAYSAYNILREACSFILYWFPDNSPHYNFCSPESLTTPITQGNLYTSLFAQGRHGWLKTWHQTDTSAHAWMHT